MEQSGKWPQQSLHELFFLITMNITSERPIAFIANVDSVVESPESTRGGELAAEVSRRVGRYRRAKWSSSAYSVGGIDGNGAI